MTYELSYPEKLRPAEQSRQHIREQSANPSQFWSLHELEAPEPTPEERQAETIKAISGMSAADYEAARNSLGITKGDFGQRASTPEELRAVAASLRGPDPDAAEAYVSLIPAGQNEYGGDIREDPRKHASPWATTLTKES
jgi:hypothetical protein